MIELRVGDMFAILDAVMTIGKQEMDLEPAERIADFTDQFVKAMQPLEERRRTLLDGDFATNDERMAAFDAFAQEKTKLPEFNFREFKFLRISPDNVAALKRAGLYT